MHHVRQDSDTSEPGQGFFEQLQTLVHQLVCQERDASEVRARAREAPDELGFDWVAAEAEHHGSRPRPRLGAKDHRPDRDDDVDLQAVQLGHEVARLIAGPPSGFDSQVPPLDPAPLAHALTERLEERQRGRRLRAQGDPTDAVDLSHRLGLGGTRRREQAESKSHHDESWQHSRGP